MISKILNFLFSIFVCPHHWVDIYNTDDTITFECTECGKQEVRKLADLF